MIAADCNLRGASLKDYPPRERAEDNLYFVLCSCRDLRLQAERMPANSSAETLLWIEREGWVADAKSRVYEMRAKAWTLPTLLIDMCRAERIAP